MNDARADDALSGECHVFCRYLLGYDAPPDVLAAYRLAHQVSQVESGASPRPLDAVLLRMARRGPSYARVADGYASVLARSSLLRRKLVLLLAILESRGSSAAALDTATPGSRVAWALGVGVSVTAACVRLCGAVMLILVLRIWNAVGGRAHHRSEPV